MPSPLPLFLGLIFLNKLYPSNSTFKLWVPFHQVSKISTSYFPACTRTPSLFSLPVHSCKRILNHLALKLYNFIIYFMTFFPGFCTNTPNFFIICYPEDIRLYVSFLRTSTYTAFFRAPYQILERKIGRCKHGLKEWRCLKLIS